MGSRGAGACATTPRSLDRSARPPARSPRRSSLDGLAESHDLAKRRGEAAPRAPAEAGRAGLAGPSKRYSSSSSFFFLPPLPPFDGAGLPPFGGGPPRDGGPPLDDPPLLPLPPLLLPPPLPALAMV